MYLLFYVLGNNSVLLCFVAQIAVALILHMHMSKIFLCVTNCLSVRHEMLTSLSCLGVLNSSVQCLLWNQFLGFPICKQQPHLLDKCSFPYSLAYGSSHSFCLIEFDCFGAV